MTSTVGDWVVRAFKANGCADCGRRFPEVDWPDLHLDHVDASTRLFRAAQLARMRAVDIIPELLKCEVRCADCHLRGRHGNGAGAVDESQLDLFDILDTKGRA